MSLLRRCGPLTADRAQHAGEAGPTPLGRSRRELSFTEHGAEFLSTLALRD
jgi:hypothetical protein